MHCDVPSQNGRQHPLRAILARFRARPLRVFRQSEGRGDSRPVARKLRQQQHQIARPRHCRRRRKRFRRAGDEQGDLPVARAYLEQKAAGKKELVIDLLHVWAEEVTDETLRRQARELHFGLT